MAPNQIFQLLDEQFKTLAQLVRIAQSQVGLIDAGRMSDLIHTLSEKTPLIAKLQDTAKTINQVDMPGVEWSSADDHHRARSIQEKCQQLSDELLRIEAGCENSLQASKQAMSLEIAEFERAAAASHSYMNVSTDEAPAATGGGNLDLSSG